MEEWNEHWKNETKKENKNIIIILIIIKKTVWNSVTKDNMQF